MALEINCSAWAESIENKKNEPLDALVLFCLEGGDILPSPMFGWLTNAPERKDFSGKDCEVAVCYKHGDGPSSLGASPEASPEAPSRVVLVGLGGIKDLTLDSLRMAAATGARKCASLGLARVGVVLEQLSCIAAMYSAYGKNPYMSEDAVITEMVCGIAFSNYTYKEYFTGKAKKAEELEGLLLIAKTPALLEAAKDTAFLVESLSAGMKIAKDVTNAPPNILNPAGMQEAAVDVARRLGFKISVLQQNEIRDLGMGAYSAVCQGSAFGGRLIMLEYAPVGLENSRPIAFVGKGVTFDTGGISLKPSAGMHEMKSDMAGAAAVLGMCEVIGRMKLPRRVVAFLACAENMPDGAASRPGDIVKTLSGKTVEIVNTDAEGRLVLCDAMTHVQREYNPELLIDIATLTGACRVALGGTVAGAYSNREDVMNLLLALSERVGDKCWPLPLWDEFFLNMKSCVADMSNAGPREGGSINAALFLKQFVENDLPWVHLDIAGPAFMEKGSALRESGATGFGVRLLYELAKHAPCKEPHAQGHKGQCGASCAAQGAQGARP